MVASSLFTQIQCPVFSHLFHNNALNNAVPFLAGIIENSTKNSIHCFLRSPQRFPTPQIGALPGKPICTACRGSPDNARKLCAEPGIRPTSQAGPATLVSECRPLDKCLIHINTRYDQADQTAMFDRHSEEDGRARTGARGLCLFSLFLTALLSFSLACIEAYNLHYLYKRQDSDLLSPAAC